uniref:Odorant receptor n=1 Tax=Athetis lepigone TaxID=1223490 RepID=A0A1B3B751_ATHLE|nr:putative odorant receptor OR9 [Athetis lepigone]
MDLNFDKIFKIVITALNLTRSHPYIARDKKWAFQFFILQGLFTVNFVVIMYNIIYHDLKANDFAQVCKNGIMAVVYVVITFQYCILLKHQDLFVTVINNIKRDYEESKRFSPAEREVIYKYVEKGIWVCKQWVVVSFCGPGLFTGKSLLLMLYYYCINDFKLVPILDMKFPAYMEDNLHYLVLYFLTYALVLEFGLYSGLMYLAYVPLGPIFILHACGQLELVAMKIDVLFVELDDEVIKRKLKNIIEHLQYIYRFTDHLNTIFQVGNELTLKGSTLMLPVTCYEILEAFNRNEYSLEYFVFIVGSTLFSSTPCFYGDLLMEKGESVRTSLYTCGWEQYYDRRTRSTLLVMLQYALRPVAIQTIFTVMCLDTLTNLFQQSYAIFNLMNAMWG